MVALVRGKASRSGRSRAPAPVISAKAKPKTSGRSTKLKAASHAGLPPRVALIAASGAVALCAGLILFTGNRMSLVQAGAGRTVYRALGAIGFEMTSLQIAGASPFATDDIVAATGLKKHDPILGIDLHAVRAKVMQVGWVDSATVTRILPGTLVIRVVERTPVAVWQVGGQVGVIDAQGRVIREADPAEFSQLPLVVGAGANASDGSVFALIRARPRLAERLEALVPGFLAAVPADTFTGRPLSYARRGDGYLLYGVGQNLADDGGTDFGGWIVGGEWRERPTSANPATTDIVVRMPIPKRPLRRAP